MKELTGEIYFHRDKWINQKQSNLKVTVKNLETASQAKTSLTVNIVEMAKNQFCQEHACFYDHISYFTAEFNQRKGQQEQIIGDVSPQIYRRLCEPLEAIYFFQNGKFSGISKSKHYLICEFFEISRNRLGVRFEKQPA